MRPETRRLTPEDDLAVPCPRCAREYDVALFQFGRTISCTCGARVGLEPRVRPADRRMPPRFAADAMLGRLARWLRLLGFDCVHDPGISDEALARLGVEDERVVLTRDRRLPREWRIPEVCLIASEALEEQLVDLIRRFDLSPSIRVLTRCSHCNHALEPASLAQVRDEVPPRIRTLHDVFRRCPECRRVYWEGSHAERIRRVAERLVDQAEA